MDQEQTKSWLKENWFKLGLLVIGLIIAYSFYQVLVVQPRVEREEEKATELQRRLDEESRRSEVKQNLDLCVANAESSYSDSWFGECKVRGLVSQKCIEVRELSFDEYLKKYNLTEEEYRQQRGITDTNRLPALLDYLKRRDDCSCSLSLAIADRLNSVLKGDKDSCYKLYPQN